MAPNPQQQHGLPPRPPGGPHSNGASRSMPQRSPLPDGRSPTPGTPSRTTRRPGTFEFKYFTPAQLEAISRRQGTRASGWDAELERKRRRNYVTWINAMCKSLGLPHVVIETAVLYMHRYYAFKSMAETDIWLMSLAATFAACKSEDNPRALQDIIYHGLRPERVGVTLKPHRPKLFERTKADEKLMKDLREWVLTAERALLYTIGFNFQIRHPQVTLLNLCTGYDLNQYSHLAPPRPGMQDNLILSQLAVEVCNKVQHTTLGLQYPPRTIGIACLYFVFKQIIKCEPMVNGKPWWMDAGGSEQDLEDIRKQLADLLSGHSDKAGGEGDGGDAAGTDAQRPPTKGAATPGGGGGPAVTKAHLGPNAESPALVAAEVPPAGEPAIGGSTSPMETRSDASDTTGAGRQGSPTAGGGFSPVVEGRLSSGLSGTKRRSPEAPASEEEPPLAKRLTAAPEVAAPVVSGSMTENTTKDDAAKGSMIAATFEQPQTIGANGHGAQAGVGQTAAERLQQAASAAKHEAEIDSGIDLHQRPELESAQPSAGSEVKRSDSVNPGAGTDCNPHHEALMSQDSVEPGELI